MSPTYEALERRIKELEQVIIFLQAENNKLLLENEKLRSQLEKNSKNSSKPPSSDIKSNLSTSSREDSRRPYHSGAKRVLLPKEMVTSHETRVVETCPRCRSKMELTGKTSTWQQIEIPPIKPLVHETELLTSCCPCCGLTTTPHLSNSEAMLLGPRLEGLINLLMAQFRQGHRSVKSFLAMLIPGLDLSQGLIAKIKQRAALAFDSTLSELTDVLMNEREPQHIDATGWRHCGTHEALLIFRTRKLIRYAIVQHQNRSTLEALLGRKVSYVVSDRGLALDKTRTRLHQYCLAHFLRNLQGAAEHHSTTLKETQTLGEVHETLQSLFHDRHRCEKGEITQSTYLHYGYCKWNFMRTSLKNLAEASHPNLKRFCKKALSDWEKFMTYLARNGPMTNNLAEEGLRNLVIARKLCFGSRSGYGRAWREALHSCIETLRRQGRAVLDFVTQVIAAYRDGIDPPKIAYDTMCPRIP